MSADIPEIYEPLRRWDDWAGGVPIVLGDGHLWFFYEPEPTPGKPPGWRWGGTPEVDRTLTERFRRVLAKWFRATNDSDRASAILEAAWFLAARNYEITQSEFGSLLENDDGSVGTELAALVLDVMTSAADLAEAA